MTTDKYWMGQALTYARIAAQQGEVPVGALIVSANQTLLGVGWNQALQTRDASAHAEVIAMREAGLKLSNHRLLGTTLYVTLEPCCMCAGMLVHARVQRLVFGTRDFKTGAAGSVYNLVQGYPLNHAVQVDEGFLQRECSALLSEFFIKRR